MTGWAVCPCTLEKPGTLTDTYDYEPFGQLLNQTVTSESKYL